MVKDSYVEEDVRSYREKSGIKMMWVALWLIVVLSMTFIGLRYSNDSALASFLAIIIFAFIISTVVTSHTTVVLNRRNATVKKIQKVLFFSKIRIYPLSNFHRVKIVERATTVEEGYMVSLYSLVLEGKNSFLELFSTDDEREGKLLQKDLSSFLQLSSD